jgi:hypothetical protein
MRKLLLILACGLGLLSSRFATDCQAQPQISLSWNSVTNPYLTGYYLAWGTNGTNFFATNTYPASQTSGAISNLTYGLMYSISVASFSTNQIFGLDSASAASPYGTPVNYITNAPTALIAAIAPVGTPPPPPVPQGAGKPGGDNSGNSQESGGSHESGSSAVSSHSSSAAIASTNFTQAQMWGIPPVLEPSMTNGQFTLTIDGTVGATYLVQSTSNLHSPSSWSAITNVTVTNIASIATNVVPGESLDAIDLAYVPGVESIALPAPSEPGMHWFRCIMPYDYAVLASIVLPPKGYNTRLVLVNLPGAIVDDCCYVSQAGSFIRCGQITNQITPISSVLQLEGSGPTIRQIATTLANNLNMNWTTASEFTYSNGWAEILATVVEADPASSDPVAGTNSTSSIVINF